MASVDAKKVFQRANADRNGHHRCATFGDFRERIRDLADLIGFKLIEEDV